MSNNKTQINVFLRFFLENSSGMLASDTYISYALCIFIPSGVSVVDEDTMASARASNCGQLTDQSLD